MVPASSPPACLQGLAALARRPQVDDACYQLDAKANHTIQRVEKMDNRLQDVHTGVQAANQVGKGWGGRVGGRGSGKGTQCCRREGARAGG